jgi:Holliday junction resolvase RusA-like endonuclease
MSKINLTLPIPPSVNNYYKRARNGRVYLSAEAKAYKELVYYKCLELGLDSLLDVPLHMDVKFFPKNNRRDLDNIMKCLWDSLEGNIYTNDKLIYKLTAEKFAPTKNNPRVVVEISIIIPFE